MFSAETKSYVVLIQQDPLKLFLLAVLSPPTILFFLSVCVSGEKLGPGLREGLVFGRQSAAR